MPSLSRRLLTIWPLTGYLSALKKKQDAERFFYSSWYMELTAYDPKTLVIQLRATVKVDLMEREREQRRRTA